MKTNIGHYNTVLMFLSLLGVNHPDGHTRECVEEWIEDYRVGLLNIKTMSYYRHFE